MLSTGLLGTVALLCVAIGFIVGALVMMVWSGGEKKESKNHKDIKESRYQEIAHIWRDPDTGKLLTELNERVLSGSQSLTLEERKQMQQAAREWAEWLSLPAVQPTQPPVPSHIAEKLAPPPPQLPSFKTGPQSAGAPPVQAVALAAEPARPAPKSMVAQIDEILQEILASGSLANKGIRLTEEPRQGVIVWVGLTRYIGIDTVPDPEVKTAIRTAVSKWERRSEASERRT